MSWCIYGGQRTTPSTPSCFRQVLVCCCTEQASCPANLHGFSPLCLRAGITAMSCWIWLYSISGDLNSGLHICRASNVPTEPSPQPQHGTVVRYWSDREQENESNTQHAGCMQNHSQHLPQLVLVFGFETGSPVSPGWPRTHYVVQKKA